MSEVLSAKIVKRLKKGLTVQEQNILKTTNILVTSGEAGTELSFFVSDLINLPTKAQELLQKRGILSAQGMLVENNSPFIAPDKDSLDNVAGPVKRMASLTLVDKFLPFKPAKKVGIYYSLTQRTHLEQTRFPVNDIIGFSGYVGKHARAFLEITDGSYIAVRSRDLRKAYELSLKRRNIIPEWLEDFYQKYLINKHITAKKYLTHLMQKEDSSQRYRNLYAREIDNNHGYIGRETSIINPDEIISFIRIMQPTNEIDLAVFEIKSEPLAQTSPCRVAIHTSSIDDHFKKLALAGSVSPPWLIDYAATMHRRAERNSKNPGFMYSGPVYK